mmetsp:Transcript_52650/g.157725  ORF Transcript_52650/g.157725 Transcript_52650/m.157725 type:complete len:100 (-) Transcript_52650:73-372(-)
MNKHVHSAMDRLLKFNVPSAKGSSAKVHSAICLHPRHKQHAQCKSNLNTRPMKWENGQLPWLMRNLRIHFRFKHEDFLLEIATKANEIGSKIGTCDVTH